MENKENEEIIKKLVNMDLDDDNSTEDYDSLFEADDKKIFDYGNISSESIKKLENLKKEIRRADKNGQIELIIEATNILIEEKFYKIDEWKLYVLYEEDLSKLKFIKELDNDIENYKKIEDEKSKNNNIKENIYNSLSKQNAEIIKDIEKKLKQENITEIKKIEQLIEVQNIFKTENQENKFRDWYIASFYDKEKNTINEYQFYNKLEENIEKYLSDKQIEEEKIKLAETTSITDEQVDGFMKELGTYNELTDKTSEIIMIGNLIKDNIIREEYLSYLDETDFNVEKVKEIFSLVDEYDTYDIDLPNYLIENGEKANTIKCILKIAENNKECDLDTIYDNLKELQNKREIDNKKKSIIQSKMQMRNSPDLRRMLNKIENYHNYSNLTVKELEEYLDNIITENNNKEYENDYDYILNENFKESASPVFNTNLKQFLQYNEENPIKGIDLPFPIINSCILGCRPAQILGIGMLSNAGKTRFLANICCYLVFVQQQDVLLMLNETSKEDIMFCIITTIINSPQIQELYNIHINKKEMDIRTNTYKDDTEKQQIYSILEWAESEINSKLHVEVIEDDYKDSTLRSIIEQNYIENGTKYIFYDTMKANQESTDNMTDLTRTATLLSEFAKKRNFFIAVTFQLTDNTSDKKVKPEDIDSNNIANSKQIYRVMDTVLFFKEIDKDNYNDYRYKKINDNNLNELDGNKRYYLCKLHKNRIGARPSVIFEVDLDLNLWLEKGYAKKQNKKK